MSLSKIENQEANQDAIVSERENFEHCGPSYLTSIDWANVNYRRAVAACLVQGVYIIERDRQENRQALAPPWWEFFQFDLHSQLIDDTDSCIFGAIYKSKHPPSQQIPSYVVAFRGTILKGSAFSRDLELDLHIIKNGLHLTSRFDIAMKAVKNLVESQTSKSNIWLTGHSLGSAMALLAGKTMAKTKIFLDSYLFNPPFFSAPLESIEDQSIKHGIRIASSFLTAGLAIAAKMKNANQQRNNTAEDSFLALVGWVPCLYVNPKDHICSEYIGYFEHRKKMEEIGAGGIERLATQNSISGVFLNAIGKESHEALHLLPSASLTINLTPAVDFKDAHGIHQWWKSDQRLENRVYS